MRSGSLPERYEEAKDFFVSLSVDDPVAAERISHAIAENDTTRIPLQKIFWAIRFGMLVDRFGIPRLVNCGEAA